MTKPQVTDIEQIARVLCQYASEDPDAEEFHDWPNWFNHREQARDCLPLIASAREEGAREMRNMAKDLADLAYEISNQAGDPYDDAIGTKDHALLAKIENMAGDLGDRLLLLALPPLKEPA